MKLRPDQLVLASRSPRRRLLLREVGIDARVIDPNLDDGLIPTPTSIAPDEWVAALAYLKARAGADQLPPNSLVLGADTVVVKAGQIIGQPRDEQHARDIIHALRNTDHEVVTGVAILNADRRFIFSDTAHVIVGDITNESIESYLATGAWRGKAGAYNLAERQEAGWPIEVTGDPTTVMGLPMNRLREIFEFKPIEPIAS
ncbi:MAG: Maf family protein [Phycisphaerales bacterium]|nr:Maf family protein [Phycisphaerales bacterium]